MVLAKLREPLRGTLMYLPIGAIVSGQLGQHWAREEMRQRPNPLDLVTLGHCSSPGLFSRRFRAGDRRLPQNETREVVLIMKREIES
jgi:hypothetical protein